jgi:hypothetical protein
VRSRFSPIVTIREGQPIKYIVFPDFYASGIHIYGDEKIKLWKRWGDGYDRLMDMSGNKSNITMEVTPFSNSVAII